MSPFKQFGQVLISGISHNPHKKCDDGRFLPPHSQSGLVRAGIVEVSTKFR
jgi:hypothetical protein